MDKDPNLMLFMLGFAASREGFNGEFSFAHCAPINLFGGDGFSSLGELFNLNSETMDEIERLYREALAETGKAILNRMDAVITRDDIPGDAKVDLRILREDFRRQTTSHAATSRINSELNKNLIALRREYDALLEVLAAKASDT